MNIWPAIAIVMLFGVAIGLLNGVTVVKTRLPSFIVTLATFFVLQGVNAALTLKLTGHDGDPEHRLGERLRLGVPGLRGRPDRLRLQDEGALVDRAHDRRRLAAREDALRQLDLRRRRRPDRRAQRRRSGRAHEDHPVRDDLLHGVPDGDHRGARAALDAVEGGHRPRVHLHHLRRRRRLPADRRLRLGDRHVLRRLHPRHGAARDRRLAVGQQLDATPSWARSSSPPCCSTP